MQNLQLFLNHQPADLGTDPLQLTFQINNLAEVQNQQGDFSKQFKLPLTQRNRRLLGFPDEVPLDDNTSYQLIPAKIVQDGLEIMPGGYATIEQVENDGISIIVRAGNSGFFTLLGDFKIWDMGDDTSPAAKTYTEPPWLPYDHRWTIANVAASQQKTSGWIWPIVDYGKISKTDFNEGIDVHYLRPGFFLKDAIDIIVKSTGYRLDTARSPIIQDPLYQKLIVQFAGDAFEHSKDFERSDTTSLSVQAVSTQTQLLRYGNTNNGGPPRAMFTNVIKNGGNSYSAGISTYQAQANVEVDILLEYNLYFRSSKDVGHVEMNIVILDKDGIGSAVLDSDPTRSDDFQEISGVYEGYNRSGRAAATITLAKGQMIYIRFELDSDKTRGILQPGARLTITEKKTNVLYGQMVQCERIFPDITQKDLLKDTLQRFGLTCQTNAFDKTVALASFADIVKNIPKAYDWSSKCLNQGKNISMRLGSYAQVNHLKYKEDESLTTVSNYNPVALDKDYFNDAIAVNDKSLPPTADLLESQFAPSTNRAFTGGYIAQVIKIDPTEDGGNFNIGTQPRLLIDQKLKLPEGKTVNLIDGETTVPITDVISVPYFHKPGGDYTLSWKDLDGQPGLRNTYYAELEHILKQAKKVTRYFMLSAKDIAELDLLTPVYLKQDGCYYYISMVDSWVKNQPCKVELVRLS